jgi:prepilin-type N-terminal cleavage/methylation domain-containing protein
MKTACRRSAFTLIEVLIVVVIMAVLAATIIPQFSSSTKDAQENSVKFNAHTMRSQIELYKVHHLGKYPTFADFEEQLTKATNAAGAVGTGSAYPYGPYMDEIPFNPFNSLNTVKDVSGSGVVDGDDSTGWQYDEKTGGIWPNHGDYKKP